MGEAHLARMAAVAAARYETVQADFGAVAASAQTTRLSR